VSSRRVLITGGAGFLGLYLTDRFRKAEMRVRLFDLAEPPPWSQELGVEYVRGDIRIQPKLILLSKGWIQWFMQPLPYRGVPGNPT